MNSVMDTLLLKNATFRTVKGKVPAEAGVNNSLQVVLCINTICFLLCIVFRVHLLFSFLFR